MRSRQPDHGDSLVGCAQIRFAAQLRHRFQRVQRRLIEDGEVFARDEILDAPFLFAQAERFPQPDTEGPALARRTIAVDYFQNSRPVTLRLLDFRDDKSPRIIESGPPTASWVAMTQHLRDAPVFAK